MMGASTNYSSDVLENDINYIDMESLINAFSDLHENYIDIFSTMHNTHHKDFIRGEYYYLCLKDNLTMNNFHHILKYIYDNENLLVMSVYAYITQQERAYKSVRNIITSEYFNFKDDPDMFIYAMKIFCSSLNDHNLYLNDIMDYLLCILIEDNCYDSIWWSIFDICLDVCNNSNINSDNITIFRDEILLGDKVSKNTNELSLFASKFALKNPNYASKEIITKYINVADNNSYASIRSIIASQKLPLEHINYLKNEIIKNNLVAKYLEDADYVHVPDKGTLGSLRKYTMDDFYADLPTEAEIGVVL